MGAAWLTKLNLFSVWSVPVRDSEIAVTVTGILIVGAAYFWREILRLQSESRCTLSCLSLDGNSSRRPSSRCRLLMITPASLAT